MTSPQPVISCRALRVFVEDKEIVRGVDLDVYAGEKHALMGPNGSGKSTLASALMGQPGYRVEGEILLEGEPVQELSPDERARRGMFLGFQYPVAVPGLSVASFMKAVLEVQRGAKVAVRAFREDMKSTLSLLDLPAEFMSRYLNDGFSGGEKKRLELMQLLMIQPRFALLDEIDSGLDIDALKTVARGISRAADAGAGVLLVTHYQRILDHVKPDRVHVFKDGRIVRSGGAEVAAELEAHGYETNPMVNPAQAATIAAGV
ncbi:MAG: Fe-S cluster assembly ATPase SufC [Pseudomonadota bacterium]